MDAEVDQNSLAIRVVNLRLDEIIASVDNIQTQFDYFLTHNSTPDNELFFIINGTYVLQDEINSLIDGSYTL